MLRCGSVFLLALSVALSQHPADFAYYHELHLPHNPPLHPVFVRPPPTQFTCAAKPRGYYADVQSGCQAYHFCWRQRLVSSDLCPNGTLFNEQFQYLVALGVCSSPQKTSATTVGTPTAVAYRLVVCDHFYNVRCGSPYEDL